MKYLILVLLALASPIFAKTLFTQTCFEHDHPKSEYMSYEKDHYKAILVHHAEVYKSDIDEFIYADSAFTRYGSRDNRDDLRLASKQMSISGRLAGIAFQEHLKKYGFKSTEALLDKYECHFLYTFLVNR